MSTRPVPTTTLEDAALDREASRPEAPWAPPESQEVSVPRILEEIVPMIATILIAAVVVALLVLYISEYARITRHGYTQMKLREELGRERLKVAMARAEVEPLKRQERIVRWAVQEYQMVPLRQVQQVPLPPSLLAPEPSRESAGASLSFSGKRPPGPNNGSSSLKGWWRFYLHLVLQ